MRTSCFPDDLTVTGALSWPSPVLSLVSLPAKLAMLLLWYFLSPIRDLLVRVEIHSGYVHGCGPDWESAHG
jgi:hypothetical protein